MPGLDVLASNDAPGSGHVSSPGASHDCGRAGTDHISENATSGRPLSAGQSRIRRTLAIGAETDDRKGRAGPSALISRVGSAMHARRGVPPHSLGARHAGLPQESLRVKCVNLQMALSSRRQASSPPNAWSAPETPRPFDVSGASTPRDNAAKAPPRSSRVRAAITSAIRRAAAGPACKGPRPTDSDLGTAVAQAFPAIASMPPAQARVLCAVASAEATLRVLGSEAFAARANQVPPSPSRPGYPRQARPGLRRSLSWLPRRMGWGGGAGAGPEGADDSVSSDDGSDMLAALSRMPAELIGLVAQRSVGCVDAWPGMTGADLAALAGCPGVTSIDLKGRTFRLPQLVLAERGLRIANGCLCLSGAPTTLSDAVAVTKAMPGGGPGDAQESRGADVVGAVGSEVPGAGVASRARGVSLEARRRWSLEIPRGEEGTNPGAIDAGTTHVIDTGTPEAIDTGTTPEAIDAGAGGSSVASVEETEAGPWGRLLRATEEAGAIDTATMAAPARSEGEVEIDAVEGSDALRMPTIPSLTATGAAPPPVPLGRRVLTRSVTIHRRDAGIRREEARLELAAEEGVEPRAASATPMTLSRRRLDDDADACVDAGLVIRAPGCVLEGVRVCCTRGYAVLIDAGERLAGQAQKGTGLTAGASTIASADADSGAGLFGATGALRRFAGARSSVDANEVEVSVRQEGERPWQGGDGWEVRATGEVVSGVGADGGPGAGGAEGWGAEAVAGRVDGAAFQGAGLAEDWVALRGCTVEGGEGRGVRVHGPGTLARLTDTSILRCNGTALSVSGGSRLHAQRCQVSGNGSAGAEVSGPGTAAMLEQCFVSHNASGLQVSCGASLALRGVVADGNRGIGLSAAGAGTLLDASDVQVRASHLHGVEVSGKARGLLSNCTVSRSLASAVVCYGGAELRMWDSILTQTKGSGGLIAFMGARVAFHSVCIEDGDGCAVRVRHAGTRVDLEGCTVWRHRHRGIKVSDGGALSLRRCDVRDVRLGHAVIVTGEGTRAALAESRVAGSRCCGVAVERGAGVTLVGTVVERSGSHALWVSGVGTRAVVTGSVLKSAGECGCLARTRCVVQLAGTRVTGAGACGVHVGEKGAIVQLRECLIAGSARQGLRASQGGHLDVRDTVVARSGAAGAGVAGQRARARLEGCALTDNAVRVVAEEGGLAEVDGCRVARSKRDGVLSRGLSSTVAVTNSDVSDCKNGAVADRGGLLRVSNSVLSGNRRCGGRASHGGRLELSGQCRVTESGRAGVHAERGGSATLRECTVERSGSCGISAVGRGSHLTAESGSLLGNASTMSKDVYSTVAIARAVRVEANDVAFLTAIGVLERAGQGRSAEIPSAEETGAMDEPSEKGHDSEDGLAAEGSWTSFSGHKRAFSCAEIVE